MTCLVLPVSNADSERTFSIVKKIQTDFWSELSVDTINSLLTTKQNQNVTCDDYEPTDNVLKVAKSATLAYNREHASSVTEKVLKHVQF